jgi:hypothetical protein
MYEACRVLGQYVRWQGGLEWDWSELLTMDIPQAFTDLIQSYLKSVFESDSEHRGWKIPETTLCFPWIARLFPEAKYIFWIRDPRDSIVGRHKTDDLRDFGIAYPELDPEDVRQMRAISWKYQYDLVQAMPKPAQWIEVRFEDFVLKQDETLARLEDFLGIDLVKVPVTTEPIGRWKTDEDVHDFGFFEPALVQYGYQIEKD